jgi:hypothetical protein
MQAEKRKATAFMFFDKAVLRKAVLSHESCKDDGGKLGKFYRFDTVGHVRTRSIDGQLGRRWKNRMTLYTSAW